MGLKGIVHPKMNIVSLFMHPISSAEENMWNMWNTKKDI